MGALLSRPNEDAVEHDGSVSAVATDSEVLAEFGDALEELFRAVLKASGRGVPGGDTELTMSQYFVMDALRSACGPTLP